MAAGTLTVRVLGDTNDFDRSMGSVGKGAAIAFAAVATAAVAGAVKGIAAFTEFQGSMNEVFTLLPGISDEAMSKMTGQVKDFSKEFGVLPDEVVPALYQALSAGVPQDNVFEFLETAQMAAKGGVSDLTTAVDGISSVVNAYGSDVIDATKASDLMFTAVRLGKTNFSELSASLSNVTPIASALGVKFEDVAAGLATMTAKGVPTAQATTQMRSLFVDLSKAGGETAKVFEDMAGMSFQEFIAAGGNTSDALAIMQKAADDSGVELQDLFGSVEAGSAALLLAGGDEYAANIAEMGSAAGATQAAFDTMMTGLGPVFDKIKAFAAVFLIEIGERLAPVLESAMARAAAAFAIVSAWWTANGPGILEQVALIRDGIVGFIDQVGPPIRSWVDNVLTSLSNWWVANSPVVIAAAQEIAAAVVVAFQGVITAGQFVIQHWDEFKVAMGVVAAIVIPHFVALGVAAVASSVMQVAAWVASGVAAVAAVVVHSAQVVIGIAKWVAMAVAATVNAAIVVAGWVATGVAAVAAAVVATAQVAIQIARWVALGAVAMAQAAIIAVAWLISMGPIVLVGAAVVALVALFIANFDTIKNTVSGAWTAVKNFTTEAWGQIKSAVSSGVTDIMITVGGIPGKILAAIGNLGSLLFGAGKAVVQGLIDGVKSAFGAVRDTFNNLTSMIPDWKGPLDKDKNLLVPAGHAIMGGLIRSIDADRSALRSKLGEVTNDINVGGSATSSLGFAGAGSAGMGDPDAFAMRVADVLSTLLMQRMRQA